jgi:hypothetical protein
VSSLYVRRGDRRLNAMYQWTQALPNASVASGACEESPMLGEPRLIQTDAQLAATIRLTIPRSEIRNVMRPAIAEVMATVAAQGIAPAGPVFSHHLRMHPDTFDFEVGAPVGRAVAPAGRVKARQTRASS